MPRPITRKKDIINAAVKLFVEKGITETTIRDIARTAKVGEGTLYRHWPSKEAMATDLFSERFKDFGRQLHALYIEYGTFAERLAAMLDCILDFHDSDPTTFHFILLVQHQSLRYVKVTDDENPVEVLHRTVKDGIESGRVRPINSQLAMSMLLGSFMQVAVSAIYGRLPKKLKPFRDEIHESMMKMLAVPDDETTEKE